MKVFVIHARRTGYGVIRSLKDQKDIQIYVADVEVTAAFRSKYISQSFLISDITKVSEEVFLEEMIALAHQINYKDEKPIVYTGKDDYLIFFSKHYALLSEYYQLSFETNFVKLNRALSKFELIDCAKKAKVLIPQTFTNKNSIEEILMGSEFPLIIKPAIKNRPELDVVSAAFRIKKCSDKAELLWAINKLSSLDVDYVIQQYIPGDDNNLLTIGTYSKNGKLVAWSTSKKIRQFPPNTGECSVGVTFYNDELVPLAERLIKEIGLTGISQIEFKKYNGEFYLIEINPRIWSWHQIHQKAGVNLALIAAECIMGKTPTKVIEPFKGKKGEKKWMFLTMDYLHNNLLNDNVSKLSILKDFVVCDMEAFFDIKDLNPFINHYTSTRKYIRSQLASKQR